MLTSIHPPRATPAPSLALPLIAAASGLTVGAATAYGQGWLGDGIGSLANSAGPWALTATLVALASRRPWAAAAMASVVLVCCELGYALATVARGGDNAPSTVQFWLAAAVLAGPPLGVAAAWSRDRRHVVRAALGAAVLPGVLVGEALWGLTEIAATTSVAYWTVELIVGAAGVVAAAWVVARRTSHRVGSMAITIGTAGSAAAALYGVAHLA